MKLLTNAFQNLPEYTALITALREKRAPIACTGLTGIHKAALISALCEQSGKPAIVVCGDESEGNRLQSDLESLGIETLFYPARDFTFLSGTASHEYEHQRIGVLSRFLEGSCKVLVCSIEGALQLTLPPEVLKNHTKGFCSGEDVSPESLESLLLSCGYERAEQVDGSGQFSRRGGILDLYPPESASPLRIEFWGDQIDTISHFDAVTQRRTDSVEEVTVVPAVEALTDHPKTFAKTLQKLMSSLRGKAAPKQKEVLKEQIDGLMNGIRLSCMDKFLPILYPQKATLLSYLPQDGFLFLSEPARQKERLRALTTQWGEDLKAYLAEGTLCRTLDSFSISYEDLLSKAENSSSVFLDVFAHGSYDVPLRVLLNFTARQLAAWGGSMELLQEDLSAMLHQGEACIVLAGTERSAKTVASDLAALNMPAYYSEEPTEVQKNMIAVMPGTLSAGMEWPGIALGIITHGKLMQGNRQRVSSKKDPNRQAISSLSELSIGDYVVHDIHGIGVFDGIHKIDTHGIVKDYIKIRYAKNDILYVPVTQLDLVSRYIGPREDSTVKLSRLGGSDWQKAKTRVRSAVKDMAKELIKLYAARMQAKGHAFSKDTDWQRDFESHFEFDETQDQLRCIEEIKEDMERPVPMDRLLCGDVGFGKTEVALRAAFKCVTDGKQCALLVPTTILAWQHYQTVTRRMEGFPVTIELLSRFRTPKQQEEILQKLKRGEVDLIIGTHRLISKDVKFRDLGLVIIDEEQRFGVAQKEKLKKLCNNVDVLTLSATPIPRTLNMAMSGIRDMSVIEEAPHDRHPVQTYVLEYDAGVLGEAVRRELRRGGQVYWLHNDVASITRVAASLKQRIPEARIGIGHGKMSEQELSEQWRQLIDHEIDVLVCTTIIETGVDVPNVNTLIIDNADRMGLSQLHQIRGRVGRSNRRAYAYLTFRKNKVLSEIAQKRLSAIREFTEFGSGFKIAMRDLEIRGAGSILGGEQHGHMEAVGYDMYLKLLSDAIAAEKGEAPQTDEECVVDLQVEAHIPESYIESLSGRLEMYRRIADIRSEEDAMDVTDELIDRYGDAPKSVAGLIQVALLRNQAGKMGFSEIKQQNGGLYFYSKTLDMKWIGDISDLFKGRVLVGAGEKPYVSLKLQPGDEILGVLKKALFVEKKTKN
ncbi:MAG: transcription-repair coupling factor [Oscillospiraceae bacterium]|jgi:transcription-repair coupling factor (superfamily II helicase)|nr:transcription-repair coupling factor [Oscillospiraceae bacterium]MCI2191533.1 transcription-repair coupling factor [Oscillospiraceae bacterium]MCI2206060.1 transcription-repair coupling factor [Oscillospiraceae bacterium]